MTARHWMQIAALTSALGLTGAAIANDTGHTTINDRSDVSGYGMDAPSSGAIVTPEDKAAGMGKDDQQAEGRNGDVNNGTPASSRSSDDILSVNPAPSNDEDSSVNPPPSNDEDVTVYPGSANRDDTSPVAPAPPRSTTDRDSASTRAEDQSAPARIGSDVRPGDMRPSNVRGE